MFNPFRSIHTGNKIDTAVSNVEPLVTQLGATTATANAALDVGNMAMAEIPKIVYIGDLKSVSISAGGRISVISNLETVFIDSNIIEIDGELLYFKQLGVYDASLSGFLTTGGSSKTIKTSMYQKYRYEQSFESIYTGINTRQSGVRGLIHISSLSEAPYINLTIDSTQATNIEPVMSNPRAKLIIIKHNF